MSSSMGKEQKSNHLWIACNAIFMLFNNSFTLENAGSRENRRHTVKHNGISKRLDRETVPKKNRCRTHTHTWENNINTRMSEPVQRVQNACACAILCSIWFNFCCAHCQFKWYVGKTKEILHQIYGRTATIEMKRAHTHTRNSIRAEAHQWREGHIEVAVTLIFCIDWTKH